MESIHARAVVRGGQVTVAVPDAPDGISVEVVVMPLRPAADVRRQLHHLQDVRRRYALPFVPPEVLAAMEEEGRP